MSKIGNYNLEEEEELRDQLNELGFETLQDALDAGWELCTGGLVVKQDLSNEAYEQAQKDWEKEKEEALTILNTLNFDIEFTNLGMSVINEYHEMIDGVIQFVEKARF